MKIWRAGLTGPVHSRNYFHCHIKDTEEFPALDPPYRGWWVEGLTSVQLLCTGRYSQSSAEEEPRSFLKGGSRQTERNWTFSGECYYKSSSERACWQEEDQIFSSSKKRSLGILWNIICHCVYHVLTSGISDKVWSWWSLTWEIHAACIILLISLWLREGCRWNL